eukprot:TRINITY_DN34156_c0_g1_i1.p1 TRINITY_DN34156_c0_g1~~TRINITY_DN34156_c0_g1_i1.p1  ORF type:complete len:187 (-),score=57.73 TRINITY_DN34156_c0_g1_i1:64-624(-)
MATSSERINSMFANSSTWRSKEEELKGRASIHESQCRKYSAANSRAFASTTVSQEELDAERQAAQKRKLQQEDELSGFMEAQNQEKPCANAVPGFFQSKAKEAPKKAGLPGFLAVKKQHTAEATPSATGSSQVAAVRAPQPAATKSEEIPEAATSAAPSGAASGGLGGLGAYGSDSEDGDEEEDES